MNLFFESRNFLFLFLLQCATPARIEKMTFMDHQAIKPIDKSLFIESVEGGSLPLQFWQSSTTSVKIAPIF
jgi:hypothetical protein